MPLKSYENTRIQRISYSEKGHVFHIPSENILINKEEINNQDQREKGAMVNSRIKFIKDIYISINYSIKLLKSLKAVRTKSS